MKNPISKNSWILAFIVAFAWSFSFWMTSPEISKILSPKNLFATKNSQEVKYKAIPKNYHLVHLQVGGSKFYREATPSWIKAKVTVDMKGNYSGHTILGSSHKYLEHRLNQYISEMRFLPAYNESGPTSSSIVLQFIY